MLIAPSLLEIIESPIKLILFLIDGGWITVNGITNEMILFNGDCRDPNWQSMTDNIFTFFKIVNSIQRDSIECLILDSGNWETREQHFRWNPEFKFSDKDIAYLETFINHIFPKIVVKKLKRQDRLNKLNRIKDGKEVSSNNNN